MEEITSKENRFVKEYRKLANQKSYRDEMNMFTVEGLKLINEAFQSNVKIEMVFVTAGCLDKLSQGENYTEYNSQESEKLFQNKKCFQISTEVDQKLSEGKSSQGIFAICSKSQKTSDIDMVYHYGKHIMLFDMQDAGNVGTIIRAAEAMGISSVFVTKSTCDIYSPKVVRGSMGSVFRMNVAVIDDAVAFLDKLNDNNVKTYASVLDSEARNLSEIKFAEPSVILIGNEGNGLADDIANKCSEKITIKMKGKTESLNAAMAACILIYEATKD